MRQIRELFALDIGRPIEEVIKVDQNDEQIVHSEISEYIVTDAIKSHYRTIIDKYWETLNKPHEGVGVWVSGFFGSGKSSFAKMLGLALENRLVQGESAAQLFGKRTGDRTVQTLLTQISEHIPTDAVIFDLSTDRGIKSGNQTITEIMYRLFLKSLGYAEDLDLAELEITLEQRGELEQFKSVYQSEFDQAWDDNKDLIAFSLGEASMIMHQLYPKRYSTPDSWVQAAQDRTDLTAGKLAERCAALMERRRSGRNLVFVVDEVGQFVSRDIQKMLDLQGVVQSLGRISRGKIWLIVTSQEKLTELVSGLDDKRVELARLMDRFPIQVHLEPSDISEVTSKRVLSKNADAERLLRELFTTSSGRLIAHTQLKADVQLPELNAQSFMDLYPLLPYQIDLIIEVVSGLRTQGGASKHVGGANRTIIKLAQQLLIHDAIKLADEDIGRLVQIDQIYDLVSSNIPSEIRGKIQSISKSLSHPLAQPVAKAICLLQYVQNIHRTAENISSTLHPSVDGDSLLSDVKEALAELVSAHKVRLHEGQYRIPTPAEDDWEVTRSGIQATPGELNRIKTEVITSLWQPSPNFTLLEAKTFKAGLNINGRTVIDEDVRFNITLADHGSEYTARSDEARSRSQSNPKEVFWVVEMSEAIEREAAELHRSKEMLSRKERNARTQDETALVVEEKARLRRHEAELKRIIRSALLSGEIYFRGNDRSAHEGSDSVAKVATQVLSQALPEVYNRFSEGAAKVQSRDLEALFSNDNLRGLPPVFAQLSLIRDEGGQQVFDADSGPLKELLDRIENRTSYGETASGKWLNDELSREPFGWSIDVIRLFVVSLLRAGKIKASSKGVMIESALSTEAKSALSNNNTFKACSFEKKIVGTTPMDWLKSDEAYRDVFGRQLPELQPTSIAMTLKQSISDVEESLQEALRTLIGQQLPGVEVLQEAYDKMRLIRTSGEDDTILTFNNAFLTLKEGIGRSTKLKDTLTEPVLHNLRLARQTLQQDWSFLLSEPDVPEELKESADKLADLLARETFFRELPAIDQITATIRQEYQRRLDATLAEKIRVYEEALQTLHRLEAWSELNEEQQARVSRALSTRVNSTTSSKLSIPHLRSEMNACQQHYRNAVQEMMQLVEGNLLVTLSASEFFMASIESPDQLNAVLSSMKQRVEKLLGEGKKVLIQ